MLAEGYTSELIDAVRKAPDRRSILTNFAKSDDARQRWSRWGRGGRVRLRRSSILRVSWTAPAMRCRATLRQRVVGRTEFAGGSGLIASGEIRLIHRHGSRAP